jgi:UDP-N-acetylmuramoyl-tripeptide--D-alanyl-D-alanine ligase
MMLNSRLDTLAVAAGGRLLSGRPEMQIQGVYTDTRSPLRGGLFVALRGDNFDGNLFARDAVEKDGASAVLVDRAEAVKTLPSGAGAILVDDSRSGLLGIAKFHRQELASLVWFGVTGSVGKSSTKEMLAWMLENAGELKVHRAKASFNNAIGMSHTILGASGDHQAVVLELGTNHPGEIAQLATVARPNIAILTCAAESHLEAFGSVQNVAKEKSEIFSFLDENDTAVLNADDVYYDFWREKLSSRVISFGKSDRADVRAKYIRIDARGCAEFMVRYEDQVADCHLKTPGIHQVWNALAVFAAGCAVGIPLSRAAQSLATFEGFDRRFSMKEFRGMTLIDDAYNANPASFSAALETLQRYQDRRKFVVAGDMLELGTDAEKYHRQLGQKFAACALTQLVTVGPLAAIAGAEACKGATVQFWKECATPEEAAKILKTQLREGDVVLVKGSHGIHLERCLEILTKD